MDTSARDALALFDVSVEGKLEGGWARGCLRQRVKTITAGPMVDVECYPVWDTRTALAARAEAKREAHRKAQIRLDAKNAQKKLDRLINANFGAGDLFLTCLYDDKAQPPDAETAMKDARNFLRRVKTLRRRRGLPELKYIYVTEETHSAARGTRYHHHAILSGDGVTRDEIEALWDRHKGKRDRYANSRRAKPNEKHLTGLAHYLTMDKAARSPEADGKNPQRRAGKRRWNSSLNLRQPVETVADKKISVRKAGQIAEATRENAREVFARLYPGCDLVEIEVKRSRWVAGVYVYAQLRKRGAGWSTERRSCAARDAGRR